jgi:anti-sigma B factor antagonist
MDLQVSPTVVAGVPTVCVEGTVDLATLGALHDALHRAVLAHPGRVLRVDLDAVTAIDDGGLGVLVGAAATARDRDGEIELVCSNPTVRRRLTATRLDRIFEIRSTVA